MRTEYSLSKFQRSNYSFALIKNGRIIFRSKAERLQPLISCIKKHKAEMRGAVVFDKIVGRAAALLLAHAKVGKVWAPTISRDAVRILTKNGIKIAYKKKVTCIKNQKGDDLCPMEKLSQRMKPDKLISFLLDLRRKRM